MQVFQTREWQERIIAGALAKGEADQLYFWICMQLPQRLRKKVGTGRLPATHPLGFMPVVCVAPDLEDAWQTAGLLRLLLEAANRQPGLEFQVMLALRDDLPEPWYEWWAEGAGNEPEHAVDKICPACGTISTVAYNAAWTCTDCGLSVMADNKVAPGVLGIDYQHGAFCQLTD